MPRVAEERKEKELSSVRCLLSSASVPTFNFFAQRSYWNPRRDQRSRGHSCLGDREGLGFRSSLCREEDQIKEST